MCLFIDEDLILLKKQVPMSGRFDPIGSACLPFSISFFLVAITFLLFDLEIDLLFTFILSIPSK
eukprot:bmy_17608T0